MLDELDRVEDDDALSLLADTVKTLSDHGTRVTLMFVGVAASVAEFSGDRQTLEMEGEPRHRAYRFRNPLFQPFVKMTARARKLIDDELAAQLQTEQAAASDHASTDVPGGLSL